MKFRWVILAEKFPRKILRTSPLPRVHIAKVAAIVVFTLAVSVRSFAQLADTCSEKTITWPANTSDADKVCAGPMEYALWCYEAKSDPGCGVDHYDPCTRPKYCQNAQAFGVDVNSNENFSSQRIIHYSKGKCQGHIYRDPETRQTSCSPDQGNRNQTCEYDCTVYDSTCADEAEQIKTEQQQQPGYDKHPELVTIVGAQGTDDGHGSITCNIVISRPVALSGRADPPCGTETYSCTDNPVYNSCRRRPDHEPDQTVCGTVVNSSAPPGTSIASLASDTLIDNSLLGGDDAYRHLRIATDLRAGPTCLTGEDQPDPVQKFLRLRGVLDRYGSPLDAYRVQPDLTTQAVSNLKVLLELHGDALQPAHRAYIENLYTQLPLSLRTDCGSGGFVPPSGLSSSCGAGVVDGVMEMCTRMSADHATPASVASVFQGCLSVIDKIQALPAGDQCRRDDYVKDYASLTESLASKQMSPVAGVSPTDPAEITRKLAAIDAWFKKLEHSVYPGYPLDNNLLAQSSRVLRAYWQSLYLNQAASLKVNTDSDAVQALSSVETQGLAADIQTLKAAYPSSGSPPLTSAPLLSVTADALKNIQQRALSIATLHDMACTFEPCAAVTPTSAFFRALGSIHSKSQLSGILDDSAKQAIGPDWFDVFSGIVTAHGAFESAFKDSQGIDPSQPYDETRLLALPLDQLAIPTQEVAQILRGAHARAKAYSANGLFTLSNSNNLTVGLNNAKSDAVLGEFNRVIGLLNQSLQDYRSNRLTLVQGLIAQIQNQSLSDSLNLKAQALLQKIQDLTKDSSGLQITSAVDEARYGQFMKGFEAIAPAIDANGQAIIVSQGAHDIDVSAADAPTPNPSDISKIAVSRQEKVWKLSEQAGDMINFYISGRWAPSCSLSQVSVNGGKVNVTDAQSQPILTGPEGYSVQQTSSGYKADSNQTVDDLGIFANVSASLKVCAGFDAFGNGAQACAEASYGVKASSDTSSTNSQGEETRSTFSYARGIRSPLAPFPDEPVGSLLLVEMPHGTTDEGSIKSVRVLISPQTSVLVSDSSDFYLVVNDSVCQNPSTAALAVRVTELQAASAAAKNMAQAMAAIPAVVRKQGEPIVAQGRILPDQINQLRQSAYQELYVRCGCTSLAAFPDSLKNLFDTYVEKELVGVQREVEMVNIERQVRETMMDVQTLQNELDHAQTTGRLAALVPAWALRNLDGQQLENSLDLVRRLLTDWIYPVVALRNPETLSRFTPEELQTIDHLTQTALDANLDDEAQHARDAATTIHTALADARIAAPWPPAAQVIFSIPKPGATKLTGFHQIDAGTSARFWGDILANKDTTLTVTPEYVYTNANPDFLPCFYSAPIVNSAVFYLVMPGPVSFPRSQLPLALSPAMHFPLVPGIEEYQFTDPSYLGSFVTVLNGFSASAIDNDFKNFWAEGNQTAAGVSPFTDWHLDLSPYRNEYPSDQPGQLADSNPWKQAVELLVAFHLEPRSEGPGQSLPGVASCSNSASSNGTGAKADPPRVPAN